MKTVSEALKNIGEYKGEGSYTTPWQDIVKDCGEAAREVLPIAEQMEKVCNLVEKYFDNEMAGTDELFDAYLELKQLKSKEMNKTELTLAIAEELHRLFPDEYGKPMEFANFIAFPKGKRLESLAFHSKFELDEKTCWQLWMRFKKDISKSFIEQCRDKNGCLVWDDRTTGLLELQMFIEELTLESFGETLLEVLRDMTGRM